MDPTDPKKKYGRQLCFWGSLDEQRTLPFGTPQEVRREVLDRLGSRAMIDTVRDTPYSALSTAL
jgi:hypothetical protein